MNSKYFYKTSLFIIGISVCLLFIFIGFFIVNFSNQSISDEIESWAQFGDYFGGVLNPILTLINICVFVILTLTIQNITDKNNKENLETSRKIALMTMKHEEYKHFKEIMDENLEKWEHSLEDVELIKTVLYSYNILEYRMLFLFPELKNSEHNKMLRKYIVDALSDPKKGKSYYHIPISNIYGMLISDLGKWIVK